MGICSFSVTIMNKKASVFIKAFFFVVMMPSWFALLDEIV